MKIFQRIIIVCVFLGVIAAAYGLELKDKYVVPILMYHRVLPDENREQDRPNVVSVDNFRYQIQFLKKNGYHVISLDELVSAIAQRRQLPRNSVVLTFDDGAEDNYAYAFPVLKEHGFSATFFISPQLIGKKGYLTWGKVKEMDQQGMGFGSHTLAHAYLPALSANEQKREIHASKKIIEGKLRHPVNNFCYPSGGFTPLAKEEVREAGYLSACTTNRGYDRFNRDVYELKRIRIGDKDVTPFFLWVKLSGYYNLFRSLKNPG